MIQVLSIVTREALCGSLLTAFAIAIAIMLVQRYLTRFIMSYRYASKTESDGVPLFTGMPFVGCLDWASRRNQFINECLSIIPGKIMRVKASRKVCDRVSGGGKF